MYAPSITQPKRQGLAEHVCEGNVKHIRQFAEIPTSPRQRSLSQNEETDQI